MNINILYKDNSKYKYIIPNIYYINIIININS